MIIATIKKGREKSILQGHPWVFSGSIKAIKGNPQPGDIVTLRDEAGGFLAYAGFSPNSKIQLRVWSWDESDAVNEDFIQKQITSAILRRSSLRASNITNAYRLIHGESDGIPGLVVDQLNDVLVVQISSAALNPWYEMIVAYLQSSTGIQAVYERSDLAIRQLEGMEERVGWIAGEGKPTTRIIEHDVKYQIDFSGGQKTGLYIDQRENRGYLQKIAKSKDILDCFSYTGGFSLNALKGGANSVSSVDSSADALAGVEANRVLNGFDSAKIETTNDDVFAYLRKLLDMGRTFDVIILDPPKFAPTRASADKAARGYKDINLNAMKLLRPGGDLLTFSCSGGIDMALFTKIVAGAAADASRRFHIVKRLHAGADHPVALHFPDGDYLKGLHLRVA
jgi:23S rRNA (cytosine1962-C5)-methyltransferase